MMASLKNKNEMSNKTDMYAGPLRDKTPGQTIRRYEGSFKVSHRLARSKKKKKRSKIEIEKMYYIQI